MELAYSQALDGAMDTLKRGSGFLPLNRLETRNWDLLASLSGLGNPAALSSLRDKFRELTGRKHVFFAASCRAAIAQILRLLPHQEVVIPAYTCGVVKLAAQIAEKKIVYADVARGGVNSTSAEFEPYARPGRVLIPTHLFGIPTDIENICELAKRRGCVTIEDAAASIAEPCGRGVLGTFSDFGVFSFERSKRFPAFHGAVIILNNESILDPEQLAQANTFDAEYVAPFQEIVSSLLYNIAGTHGFTANMWFRGN
jgi:dTDP-4-amino-4,6-dideoxygalactose transaminase